MITHLLKSILAELGPVGLLVLGLYFVMGQHLKKIAKHVEIINKETGNLRDALKDCTTRICDTIHGKN